MIVQMRQISPNLKDADAKKNAAASVPCAREGDVSNFVSRKAIGNTMDCAVQRETGSTEKTDGIVYSEAEARQLNMDETELPKDNSLSPADFISRCMTGEDAQGVAEEGTPLEEYTSSQLERAVRRVKEQRTDRREAVDAQVSREQEEEEVLEASAEEGIAEEKISREILKIAAESGLSDVPGNVSRLAHAAGLTAGLPSLSQASMKFFVDNEWDITPEHISASMAEDSAMPPMPVVEDTFSQIEGQVQNILSAGGVEVTEESMATAKWLYENDLPVTADSVKLCKKLEELKGKDPLVLTERIADEMADGTIPEKADLTKISVGEAREVVKEFSAVSEEVITQTYPEEADQVRAKRQLEEIRLSMTVQAARNMSAKGIDLDVAHLEQVVEGLRQQEQQVRTGYLLETGLPVTDFNKEVVYDTIKAAKDVLAAPVEVLGAALSQGGRQTLGELSDMAVAARDRYHSGQMPYIPERARENYGLQREPEDISGAARDQIGRAVPQPGEQWADRDRIGRAAPQPGEQWADRDRSGRAVPQMGESADIGRTDGVYGRAARGSEEPAGRPGAVTGRNSLDPASATGRYAQSEPARGVKQTVEVSDQFSRMEHAYETVGTQVRTDLGDSIQKAFGNINTILEDLQLEVNGRNQRAVRILGYNQMEITKENIYLVKEYDAKVTSLMENLKPPVVAKMVQDQINPLDMSVDELNRRVKAIQQEIVTEDVSFRKFLWKMDHQGQFSKEERQSMIGVYRLLDKVEKSDGAAIGRVAREGRVLSLYSLLSAVRSKKAEGMDVEVDEDVGGLIEIKNSRPSISDQIDSAYGQTLAKHLKQSLDPVVLKRQRDAGVDISLERLLELCENREQDEGTAQAYYQYMTENVQELFRTMDVTGQDILDALELPTNAANLEILQSWMRNGNKEYASLWKPEESEELLEILDKPEELEDFYAELDREQTERLTERRGEDDVSYSDVMSIARMANSISFYRRARTRQMYEVPIVTEQGVTTCSVTIQDGRGDKKGMVEISMQTEDLGRIQASYKVKDKRIRGFVTAEYADGVDVCRRILRGFEKDLQENGFIMESESLMQGSRRSLHVGDKSEGTKNRDLYQVAKLFISNVNRKEDEE